MREIQLFAQPSCSKSNSAMLAQSSHEMDEDSFARHSNILTYVSARHFRVLTEDDLENVLEVPQVICLAFANLFILLFLPYSSASLVVEPMLEIEVEEPEEEEPSVKHAQTSYAISPAALVSHSASATDRVSIVCTFPRRCQLTSFISRGQNTQLPVSPGRGGASRVVPYLSLLRLTSHARRSRLCCPSFSLPRAHLSFVIFICFSISGLVVRHLLVSTRRNISILILSSIPFLLFEQ